LGILIFEDVLGL